ncbi:MAG: hypothetical protein A3B66_02325 [Alphaproteobacteria bacterium RIFCSPHIGHO2_02_FULL_46_13]|nr:MAG: hypothetical protein A3B66_02325 [Alphaproteobacteria bacterium RIFCSPHIGHO2_02_FULL_46_13]
MSQIQVLTKNNSLSDILNVLEKDGCVVIEGLIAPNSFKNIQTELKNLLKVTADCSGDFYGYKTKRISGLVEKLPEGNSLIAHPTILAVMDHFLLPGCTDYHLNLTQAISIGPGEPAQIIHRDDAMFPYKAENSEKMMNCMWAVDDFTIDNGATQLVPGSHLWAEERNATPEEITYGVMKAGSVLIYLGSLLHSGGANRTSNYRTGIVYSYALGWLKQAENQFLATSREVASKLPDTMQKLLGYFVHKPNLGCVDGLDPKCLLSDIKEETVFTEFLPDEVVPILREYRASL